MKVEKRLIYLDNKKRKYVNRYYLKRKLSIFILSTLSCTLYVKQTIAFLVSNSVYSLANPSIVHSRCILTGRSYGISSNLKTSRFASRILINSGLVNGFTRHSW